MPFATLLEIDGIDLGDYGARALTMTLTPVAASVQIERNINGKAIDMSMPQFRKYEAVVSCTDFESPILVGVHPGTIVHVVCVPELGLREDEDSTNRLAMYMMVGQWQVSRDEWGARTSWTLPLFEV